MPLPEGPFGRSYAGCLSDHAVCPPAARITSNTVLVRMKSRVAEENERRSSRRQSENVSRSTSNAF